jgi:hypothetical protein
MGEFKSPSEKQSTKATPAKKSQENSSVAEADFLDSRSSTFQLKKFQEAAQENGRGSGISSLQTKSSNHTGTSRIAQLQGLSDTRTASEQSALIQKKENKTGIPDGLKSGMESVSGISLNDVTVHRNSDKPAQLQAHAYAQGTDVHLAPGQEKHLPHELGHVVQQKQGRVKATAQLKGKVPINDDKGLETEADLLGKNALSFVGDKNTPLQQKNISNINIAQFKWKDAHELAASDPKFKQHRPRWVNIPDEVTDVVQAPAKVEAEVSTDAGGEVSSPVPDAPKGAEVETAPEVEKTFTDAEKEKVDAETITSDSTELEAPQESEPQEESFAERISIKDEKRKVKEEEEGDNLGKLKIAAKIGGGINSGLTSALGDNGKLAKNVIKGGDSKIAGTTFSSLQSMVDLVKSGAKMWEKRDWESGADFFLQVADTAKSILDTLKDYEVMGAVPVLGPAIEAFKAGMGIFKANRSLTLLKEFEDGKKATLNDDEILALQRYVSSLKVERGSNAIDFALSLGQAVGDFFPPVGQALGIVKGVKGAFEAGYNAWVGYKSSKEKQALTRISGGKEAELGAEELAEAGALSAKASKAEPDSLKSSKGTLKDMVDMKFEIEDVKSQIVTSTDEAAKKDLVTKESTLNKKLEESIAVYNSTMGNIDPSAKITLSDVDNLQAIHARVIKEYLEKKDEEKSAVESFKSWFGSTALTASIAPKKDKIMKELAAKGLRLADPATIKDLSKGIHGNDLWEKTQTALKDASKGRSYFTREELNTTVTAILKKYEVPADDIRKIVER